VTPSGEYNYNFFTAQRFVRLCKIFAFLNFWRLVNFFSTRICIKYRNEC